MIKIHAKSVGESLQLKYKDADDGKTYPLEVNLDELDVTFDPNHNYTIKITDDVGLKMRDLTFDKLMEYQKYVEDVDDPVKRVELSFETMIDCIEALYDEDRVYKIGEDTTREELVEFINDIVGITKELFGFLNTMPHVRYETTLPNGKKVVIKDIKSFLA